MLSQFNAMIECPHCKQMTGYHFSREGQIFSNEIIGRFSGNTLACVHCKRPIELMIHFIYRKAKTSGG